MKLSQLSLCMKSSCYSLLQTSLACTVRNHKKVSFWFSPQFKNKWLWHNYDSDIISGWICSFSIRFSCSCLLHGCVSGPGQPCCGDTGPGHFPAVGEEKKAYRNMDGGLLRAMVWPMPGFASWVEEDGSGNAFKSIYPYLTAEAMLLTELLKRIGDLIVRRYQSGERYKVFVKH